MLLHIHKEETDKLWLEQCLNTFAVDNEHRLAVFGRYTLWYYDTHYVLYFCL